MWQNSHFAKERVRRIGLVFPFTFSFLELLFCKEMKTSTVSEITVDLRYKRHHSV